MFFDLSGFRFFTIMLPFDSVSWIFVICLFSITCLPVLYKAHSFSLISFDRLPTTTIEFTFFADEVSNMISELIIWPVSFLPSSRLKNPFKESMMTKDFVFDILSTTALKFSCKMSAFGQIKVVVFGKGVRPDFTKPE